MYGLLLTTALATASPLPAFADESHHFEISTSDAPQAIHQFGRQSGIQILASAEQLAGKKLNEVAGTLSTDDGLSQLLAGTGITHRYVGDRTVALVVDEPGASAPAERANTKTKDRSEKEKGAQKTSFWDRFRLAQADQARTAGDGSVDTSAAKATYSLEEVIVTAQKRSERLIDVPISIVALGAEELARRKVSGIDDLSSAVPGLAVQSGSGQRRITLRGVSNFTGSSSLIGMYLDEASVTSATPVAQLDLRTYDLERVEVLRGPQGTLYGEGSVGGTIRFISRNPELDRFAMSAEVAATFTEDGSPGERVEAVLNVPVIDDELGFRVAGTVDHQGGWMDQPAAGRDDFNEQKLADVRVKGLWQPTAEFTANAMAVIHRNDTAPNNGEDANGNFTQAFNLTATPDGQDDYEIYNLTLAYDLAAFRVLNTTSYVQQERQNKNLGYGLPLLPPGQPAFDVYAPLQIVETDALTEELRLTSLGSGPWQWTVGAFYRKAELDLTSTASVGIPGPPGAPVPAAATQLVNNQFTSWAVFGDSSYRLTDRLTLGTGLRYFEDDQEYATGLGTLGLVQTERFDALNPRFYAQYKLADGINVHASAAKGFRSGGFNSLNQPAYEPESVWTYELGTKMSVLGSRLSVETALFYTDYEDYQIAGILPPPAPLAIITSNVGRARVRGIELGVAWYPLDRWSLSFNGSYADSAFYEIDAASASHRVGDPLDLFPKYGFSAATQRDLSWGGRPGFARLDYNHQGRSTFRNRRFGPWYFSESDVINMLNFSASLQCSERLSLGVFAQNLLDDRGLIDPMSIQEFAARSRPRTFGVSIGVTF